MIPMSFSYFTIGFIALVVCITFAVAYFLRRLFLRSTLLEGNFTFFPRAVGIAVILAVVIVVTGYVATVRLLGNEENRVKKQANLTLSMIRTVIEGSINRINAGATTIAGSPWIPPALSDPTQETIAHANAVLDRYRRTFGAAVVYLLDTGGVTIASSNRNDHDSFVGKNYSFRPYFTGALSGVATSYFAVGITSGKRGYYRSTPVVDPVSGSVIGVAVIKNSLQELDSVFASVPDAYLIDQHNMIFLASDTLHQGRLFCRGKETISSEIELKAQYGTYSLEALLGECRTIGNTVRYKGENYLFTRTVLQVPGWSLVLIAPLISMQRYYLLGLSVTVAFLLIVLVIFSLMVLQQFKTWAESVFLSEKRFRTIFEAAPEAIVIAEPDTGIIVAANPLAHTLVGSGSGPVTLSELLRDDDGGEGVVLPLTPDEVQGVYRVRPGKFVRSFSVSSAPILFRGQKCVVSFCRDITAIIETQNALAASEQQYRELTELLPEGVFEISAEGKFSYANRRALTMFGYSFEDLAARVSPVDVVIPEDAERAMANFRQIMHEHSRGHHEYTARHTSGRTFPALVYSTVMFRENEVSGICGIVIDLTERKRIEHELQKKDKLEALGILAGGIAHDFNNLLTAIWSGFSMIRLTNPEITQIAEEMENAIRRGKDLTGQLLTYSKGGAPVKSITSLENLVKETSGFITTGTKIKCTIDAEANLLPADVDATQISQVIQNLLINSIEAMTSGGIVTIRLQNRQVSASDQGEIPPGRYVEMIITDAGGGVPKEIQSRIFDPFYTTKSNGSGLGLATTYSIVKKHNGYISVNSTLGKGASFHVVLPASEKSTRNAVAETRGCQQGKGRVLVMDDERTILTVTEKLLTMMGYEVATACDGDEAIERYRVEMEKKTPFGAVILDLTVPAGKGGREAVRQILEIDPAANVIVSSGYSNDPIMANYRDFGFKAVIAKPYNVQQLNGVIQSLLQPEESVE